MYKILLSALLVFCFFTGFAQKAVVQGRVIDSLTKEAMDLATVSILNVKDTTADLVSYTATDKKGTFALHNLPPGIPLKLLITFVGYKPYRKFFTLNKGENVDLGAITMSPRQLGEVTITSERPPIVFKKDTIEFAAEAFKTRPNAVVEELLKKLPGVEVDNQGHVTMNGKEVTKVLVDGREFFSNDLRIATKNLDAELIDKVQIYDDREDDPDHLKPDFEVKKIINLKFKKKLLKSVFGKVFAGAGTEKRYESGGLLNLFKDTLQVSLIGTSNNLGSTGFDFNELYNNGGLNRGGSGSGFGGTNLFGRPSSGIQQSSQGGSNINTDYGKKLKINLVYYYTNNQTKYNSLSTRDQFTKNLLNSSAPDTDLTTNSINSRMVTDIKHNINITVRSQPNEATQITYNPQISFTSNRSQSNASNGSFSNFIPLIGKTTSSDSSVGNYTQFQHSFTYNKQLEKKGSSFNISHNLSISPNVTDDISKSAYTSFVSVFPSFTLNRYGANRNNNILGNLGVDYRYPLSKKLTASIGINTEYYRGITQNFIYDFNPATAMYDVFLVPQSNDLTRNLWTEHITPGITYNFTDNTRVVISLNAQYQQTNDQFGRGLPDMNQTFFYVLPTVNLSSGTYNKGSYNFSYSQSIQIPNIGNLIPYTVVYSPLSSATGNPNLKPTRVNSFSLGYNVYNTQKQVNIYLNGGFSFDEDDVFNERTVDVVGAETSMPINRSGRYSSRISGNYNKRFKKTHGLQLNASTYISANQSHNFFEINHQDGYQNTFYTSFNEHLGINWKDIITLDPTYSISNSFTTYTGLNYANVSNLVQTVSMPYNIYWPAHTNISGTYNFTYNALVSPGFQKTSNLLNVSIARQFLKKDRAEIKLSCYDILDQAIGTSRSVRENIVSDSQSEILKRYFMITLRWKFSSNKVAEKSKTIFSQPVIFR